jgi:glucose/mannose-6-phosphate isomerase
MSHPILDQAGRLSKLDPDNMIRKVLDFSAQCQNARYPVLAHPPKLKVAGVRQVILAGLGGSAIGGDILKSLIWKTAKFSLTVNRHYTLPGWAAKETLVVCSSYSGGTEETLSVFKQAIARKLKVLVMTSGGELMKLAVKAKVPVLALPGGLPPRAALGYSFFTLLTALETLKLLPSYAADFDETMEILTRQAGQYGPLTPAEKNPAKLLALFLHNHLPLFYAGQDHLDSVGLRWKTQMNENAKQIALFNIIPEMNHNEILGYSFHEPLTKKMAVVLLRQPQVDHPQIHRRFDLLKKMIASKTGGVTEVEAKGKSLLAQLFSLIYLGDFASVYLAYLKGADPTPIGLIDEFKSQLSRH